MYHTRRTPINRARAAARAQSACKCMPRQPNSLQTARIARPRSKTAPRAPRRRRARIANARKSMQKHAAKAKLAANRIGSRGRVPKQLLQHRDAGARATRCSVQTIARCNLLHGARASRHRARAGSVAINSNPVCPPPRRRRRRRRANSDINALEWSSRA